MDGFSLKIPETYAARLSPTFGYLEQTSESPEAFHNVKQFFAQLISRKKLTPARLRLALQWATLVTLEELQQASRIFSYFFDDFFLNEDRHPNLQEITDQINQLGILNSCNVTNVAGLIRSMSEDTHIAM